MEHDSSTSHSVSLEGQTVLATIRAALETVIVGQEGLIRALLISLLTGGHLLVEGIPGIAKTLAAHTLARLIQADFKRIQFTPDLLPADLIGTPIYKSQKEVFEIKKGPVFTNFLLADEINRAPAKVQSALLEVMQEKQVTIGGETFPALSPFLVIATQNPIEQEGTYPLAEAQTDRFMLKVIVGYPTKEEEKQILNRMGGKETPQVTPLIDLALLRSLKQEVFDVYVDPKVIDYIVSLTEATRHPPESCLPWIALGSSPRGSLALLAASRALALLRGRSFVVPKDVREMAYPVFRHRIRLTYEAQADNIEVDRVIQDLLEAVPIP